MKVSLHRLPLRVRPAPFEPAWALFNRLVLRHGCVTGTELAQQLQIPSYGYFVTDVERGHTLATVAALTVTPLEHLRHRSILRDGKRLVLAGETITKSGNTGTAFGRVCTDCLKLDMETRAGPTAHRPWRRSWWDVAPISTCPIHGRVLLSACPHCGVAFDRKTLSPMRCPCGQEVVHGMSERLQPDDHIGDAYLVGRLVGAPRITHEFLDGLAFADAVDVMRWVGAAALWGSTAPSWTRSTPGDRARAMSAGFRACLDFPRRFNAVLDQMLETCPVGRRSPMGVYGKLQNWLGLSAEAAFEPLRVAVRHHIEQHIPITAQTRVLGQPPTGGELTTIGAVAKLCRCSVGRVTNVAVLLSLMEPSAEPTRSRVAPRSIEAPLVTFFRSSCETSEARKYLNIKHAFFKTLVHQGLIARAFPSDGVLPSRYIIADLDQFLTRLHRNAPLMDHSPPGCAPIMSAVRICFRSSEEIVTGLLRGDFWAVGRLRHERGILQIVVNTSEVNGALHREAEPGFMRPDEAVKYLGVTPDTVYMLKREKWLRDARMQSSKQMVPAFERAELESFKARFVTLAELARMPVPSTRPSDVHQHLLRAGIWPTIPGGKYIPPLFERSLAAPVIREAYKARIHKASEGHKVVGINYRFCECLREQTIGSPVDGSGSANGRKGA
ncbi:hypothetical protein [Mesorhizobium sp. M0208]|uniref:TniQ family protein n=1 Tax=Mesorhizobium sp. M0208 TaxID=2956916 RepID=UPI003334B7B6